MTQIESTPPSTVEDPDQDVDERHYRLFLGDLKLMVVVMFFLMLPFDPVVVLVLMAFKVIEWAPVPVGLVLVCGRFGPKWLAPMASVGLVAFSSWFISRWPRGNWGNDPLLWWLNWIAPSCFFGPLWFTCRAIRRRRVGLWPNVTSGEILCAWLGLAWLVLLTHRSLGLMYPPGGMLRLMGGCGQLTALLAIFLVRWGRRPSNLGEQIAHHAGWGLAQACPLFWGLFVIRFYPRDV